MTDITSELGDWRIVSNALTKAVEMIHALGRVEHPWLNAAVDIAKERAADRLVPIDMILHCPACGVQHIDAPETEPGRLISGGPNAGRAVAPYEIWTNPPHRSHVCKSCAYQWRPADVPTNGVKHIITAHTRDNPAPAFVQVFFLKNESEVERAARLICEQAAELGLVLRIDQRCKPWGVYEPDISVWKNTRVTIPKVAMQWAETP